MIQNLSLEGNMNYSNFVSDSITEEFGDDLMPHYQLKNSNYKVTEEYIFFEEDSEGEKEFKRKKLENREKNFSKGVDLFKDFQYLDVHTLEDDDTGWNYFNGPNVLQYLDLVSSIQSIGLFTPLIVQKKYNGKHMIISGHSRAKALRDIYKNTKNERYLYAPCFIIGEDVEEYFIRSLIIDSNISYKTINRKAYMRAIFERFELLQRTKNYKNEINIAQTLADEFGVSRGTINNYLALKKLCPEAQTLVSTKELNLTSAKILAKFRHEDQLYILEHTNIKNINENFKANILTKNIDLAKPTQKELDEKMETLERIVPATTTVNVKIAKDRLKRFLNLVIDFKKVELAGFSRLKDRKYIKNTVNVSLNKNHMKYYVSKGLIDEALIKRACSSDYYTITVNNEY